MDTPISPSQLLAAKGIAHSCILKAATPLSVDVRRYSPPSLLTDDAAYREEVRHAEAALPSTLSGVTHSTSTYHREPYTIGEYIRPSFTTAAGAYRKRYYIKRKGLPTYIEGWHLIFTVNPKIFDGPRESWDAIKKRLPRVFEKLKLRGYPWKRLVSKYEFHRNGYPHVHVLIELPQDIDPRVIESLWRIGKVEVTRVQPRTTTAVLNYLMKCIGRLPDWARSLPAGTRFWQASDDFYEKSKELDKPATPPFGAKLPQSLRRRKSTAPKPKNLGEQEDRATKRCIIGIPLGGGRYRHLSFLLTSPVRQFIERTARTKHDGVAVIPSRSRSHAGRIETTSLDWLIDNVPSARLLFKTWLSSPGSC